jgi:hypothetical protein
MRVKNESERKRRIRAKFGQSFGRENGIMKNFVKHVYIGKGHRATLGDCRATKWSVTVK